jgi:hypothetical protein
MRGWLFVAALALAACQTQTMERDSMGLWKQGEGAQSPPPARPEPAQDEPLRGTVVSIPGEVAQAQTDFVNRPSTIFADVVEVDMSRDGWFALVSIAISPDAVTRREEDDNAKGIKTITLQRVKGVPATQESIPTVRFGDGLRVVGVDCIVLRFWTRPSADRPQWFHAAGRGQVALYAVEADPRQEWRGRTVDVRAEITKAGASYRFVSDAGAKP